MEWCLSDTFGATDRSHPATCEVQPASRPPPLSEGLPLWLFPCSITAATMSLASRHRAVVGHPLMLVITKMALPAAVAVVFATAAAVGQAAAGCSGTLPTAADVAASILNDMNRTVSPCDDMYEYACGGWEARTTIRPSRTSESRAGGAIDDRVQAQLRALLEGETERSVDGATAAAIAAAVGRPRSLYASCLAALGDDRNVTWTLAGAGRGPVSAPAVDLAAADGPLAALMAPADAIEAVPAGECSPTVASVCSALGAFHTDLPGAPLVGPWVEPDPKRPSMLALFIGQSDLGMGDRDLYIQDGVNGTAPPERVAFVELLTALASAASTAGLLGGGPGSFGPWADASSVAEAVLKLETRLAVASKPYEELRDPDTWYNPTPLASMPFLAAFLAGARVTAPVGNGTDASRTVIVRVPSYMVGVANIVDEAVGTTANAAGTLSVLRAYAVLRAVRSIAKIGAAGPTLYAAIHAHRAATQGTTTAPPQWETCLGTVASTMPEAIGAAYVAAHFPEAARTAANDTAAAVLTAFGRRVAAVPWMDAATKAAAAKKLEAVNLKIGYKDGLDTLNTVIVADPGVAGVDTATFAANLATMRSYNARKEWARLNDGGALDKGYWWAGPAQVTAYYWKQRNEITTPAAFLQAPFWSPDLPTAMNLGAIGVVFSHEVWPEGQSGRRTWLAGAGGKGEACVWTPP